MNQSTLDLLKAKLGKEEIDFSFTDILFSLQKEVFESSFRNIALDCGRRSGKTVLFAVKLLYTALKYKRSRSLYIAKTNQSAYFILWDILKELNDTFSLGFTPNESRYIFHHPNGSTIRVVGCDDIASAEKLRGLKFKFVAVDEAGIFKDYLNYLIKEVLGPTLADLRGELWLAGTPNRICSGFFHDAVKGEKGFKVYHWTVFENEKFPAWCDNEGRTLSNWQQISKTWWEQEKIDQEIDEQSPECQREWFCRWIKDDEAIVIDLDEQRNIYSSLPDTELRKILGVDLGYNDAFAMAVVAYSPYKEYSDHLYVLDLFTKSEQIIDEDVEKILEFNTLYKPNEAVMDTGGSGGKKFLETFNAKYGTQLIFSSATKQEKVKYADILSNDAARGKILFAPGLIEKLKQMKALVWTDKNKAEIKKPKNQILNAYDALLYAARRWFVYCLTNREIPKKLTPEEEFWDRIDKRNAKESKIRRRFGFGSK